MDRDDWALNGDYPLDDDDARRLAHTCPIPQNGEHETVTPWLDDGDVQLYHGDAIAVLRSLPAGSVQMCVTSPPFFQLRDYGVEGQIGLEATVADYVCRLVDVFRGVRRVLRDDATLWLELGDSYLLGKQLAGVPWTVAFALQADGWVLRSDVVWSRPNPMPESVADRPTKSHSYVFLLAKQPRYFYDADAIREPHQWEHVGATRLGSRSKNGGTVETPSHGKGNTTGSFRAFAEGGRNARSVWEIATQPTREAHFATFPEALVRRCILAGTSEHGGCSNCGAPWVRQTDTSYDNPGNRTTNGPRSVDRKKYGTAGFAQRLEKRVETTGWVASCGCGAPPAPQQVLDPFVGSGTTALVARKHGRRATGIDLSSEYLEIASRRLAQQSLFA